MWYVSVFARERDQNGKLASIIIRGSDSSHEAFFVEVSVPKQPKRLSLEDRNWSTSAVAKITDIGSE